METSITSKILSIVFFTFFGLSSYAQENQKEMDIDLTTFCKDQSSASHEALQKERETICGQINHLGDKNIPPVIIEKKENRATEHLPCGVPTSWGEPTWQRAMASLRFFWEKLGAALRPRYRRR